MESESTVSKQLKFRKRPIVVEAMQYPGLREHREAKRVIEWVNANGGKFIGTPESGLHINTLEGPMLVRPDWWIIRGIQGEFYSCAPDIFEETYEEVEAPNE